ncbi:MAG: hypothetical protein AB7O97_16525 [Planctomycetota bacterium]
MRSPIAAAAVVAFAALLSAQGDAATTDIHWHTDLASARAAARDQHQPLLLLFRCER